MWTSARPYCYQCEQVRDHRYQHEPVQERTDEKCLSQCLSGISDTRYFNAGKKSNISQRSSLSVAKHGVLANTEAWMTQINKCFSKIIVDLNRIDMADISHLWVTMIQKNGTYRLNYMQVSTLIVAHAHLHMHTITCTQAHAQTCMHMQAHKYAHKHTNHLSTNRLTHNKYVHKHLKRRWLCARRQGRKPQVRAFTLCE